MGEVGRRESRSEPRAAVELDPVGALHQLRCRSADEATAAPEFPRAPGGVAQAGSSCTSTSTGATPETSRRRRTADEGR
jgi:hypothetical protein